jgi:hypothetical protein
VLESVRVVVRMEGRSARASVEFRRSGGPDAETIEIGGALPVAVQAADADGLLHVEIPRVLRAAVLVGSVDPPRVVYAWTTLMAALGLRGGTYDRPDASRERR